MVFLLHQAGASAAFRRIVDCRRNRWSDQGSEPGADGAVSPGAFVASPLNDVAR